MNKVLKMVKEFIAKQILSLSLSRKGTEVKVKIRKHNLALISLPILTLGLIITGAALFTGPENARAVGSCNVTQFSDFATCWTNNAAETDIDITITNDFDITGQVTIPAGKAVTVHSDAGQQRTLTRGSAYAGRIFSVLAGAGITTALTLDSITIDGDNQAAAINNQLIYMGGAGDTTVNVVGSSVLKNNQSASNGGAIYISTSGSANLNISGTTLIDNNSANQGGGIFTTSNGATVNISGSTRITNNQAVVNSGGGMVSGGNLTISGAVVFDGNQAQAQGGGIVFTSAPGTNYITDATFTNNKALTDSGGGIKSSAANLVVTDTLIENNEAVNGGGVAVTGGLNQTATITGNTRIVNNTADNGGGLFLKETVAVNVTGNTLISGNEATIDGGGAFVRGDPTATLNITGGTVTGNTAGNHGGGIWVSYQNLGNLNVGAGVVFSGNSAATPEPRRAQSDDSLYNAHIFATNWTSPFTQGYNNYDIAYASDLDRWTVSFQPNGGSPVSDLVLYDGDLLFDWPDIATARSGYQFTGWFVDAGLTVPYDFSVPVTADFTLYAGWQSGPVVPGVPNTGAFRVRN